MVQTPEEMNDALEPSALQSYIPVFLFFKRQNPGSSRRYAFERNAEDEAFELFSLMAGKMIRWKRVRFFAVMCSEPVFQKTCNQYSKSTPTISVFHWTNNTMEKSDIESAEDLVKETLKILDKSFYHVGIKKRSLEPEAVQQAPEPVEEVVSIKYGDQEDQKYLDLAVKGNQVDKHLVIVFDSFGEIYLHLLLDFEFLKDKVKVLRADRTDKKRRSSLGAFHVPSVLIYPKGETSARLMRTHGVEGLRSEIEENLGIESCSRHFLYCKHLELIKQVDKYLDPDITLVDLLHGIYTAIADWIPLQAQAIQQNLLTSYLTLLSNCFPVKKHRTSFQKILESLKKDFISFDLKNWQQMLKLHPIGRIKWRQVPWTTCDRSSPSAPFAKLNTSSSSNNATTVIASKEFICSQWLLIHLLSTSGCGEENSRSVLSLFHSLFSTFPTHSLTTSSPLTKPFSSFIDPSDKEVLQTDLNQNQTILWLWKKHNKLNAIYSSRLIGSGASVLWESPSRLPSHFKTLNGKPVQTDVYGNIIRSEDGAIIDETVRPSKFDILRQYPQPSVCNQCRFVMDDQSLASSDIKYLAAVSDDDVDQELEMKWDLSTVVDFLLEKYSPSLLISYDLL